MILTVDTISNVSPALKIRIQTSLNNNNIMYAAYFKSHSKKGFLTSVHFLQKHKSICQGNRYYKTLRCMTSKKLPEK